MRVAVVGSRGLMVNDLEKYMPREVTEIVSGGAMLYSTATNEI